MDDVNQRIRLAIELRGSTVNATGERAGMSRGHLANVLSGRRQGMSAETLLAIAKALNVTTDWLLTGEGPIERAAFAAAAAPAPKPTLSNSEPLQERAAQRAERAVAELTRDLAARPTPAPAKKLQRRR